jgi:uncharacterized protein
MVYYFDTSVLVKRYDSSEVNSAAVMAFFATQPVNVSTCILTSLEIASAFRIKERFAVFTPSDVVAALLAYDNHVATDYLLIAPQPSTYVEARRLVLTHKLRSYDAMHIATALLAIRSTNAKPSNLEFHTADKDQATAAKAEGLIVVLY